MWSYKNHFHRWKEVFCDLYRQLL
jgi:hypothetical protein